MSLEIKSPCTNSDDLDLRDLNKKRGNLRGRITLFGKYISSLDKVTLEDQQVVELQLRISNVEQLFKEFQVVQTSIENIYNEDELTQQLEIRETIESQYYKLMSLAKCISNKHEVRVVPTTKCSGGHNANNIIKLPTISLPSFDGSYENWLEYRDTHLSLIHSAVEINPIQKFHYLRSSLKGSALQVIKSLEFTSENYQVAWDLLTNRFDNNRLLISNHVKSLFSLQTITRESPTQLRKLIDSVLKNLRSLKIMGEPTEYWDTLVIYLVVSKLDPVTNKEWEDKKSLISKDSTKVKLNDLLQFLRDRSDVLDMLQSGHKHSNEQVKKSTGHNAQSSTQIRSFVSQKQPSRTGKFTVRSNVKCVMCNGNHELYSCIRFLNLPVQDRIKFVSEKDILCSNCLRTGHSIEKCQFGPCKQCSQKHNSLIHIDNSASCNSIRLSSAHINTDSAISCASDSACADISSLFTHTNDLKQAVQSIPIEQVLLSTAVVEVWYNNSHTVARALLDSGSQRCFVTETLCKKLRLKPLQSTLTIAGVGNTVMRSHQSCDLLMHSKNSNFSTQISCSVLPKITNSLPNSLININSFEIPQNVTLADPNYHTPSDIDLLIGADVFWSLLQEGRMRLSNGPYLQNTHLGWIISGTLSRNNYSNSTGNSTSNIICCAFTSSLDDQLKRFWELEEVDNKSSTNLLTADEKVCEDLFTSTTTRNSDGRFVVQIPLRESADSLGDSYVLARNRFLSLERKLDRSPEVKQMYSDFLKEYLALGHMTRIDTYMSPYYFLPHHCVQRESTTTKLRVVFDAGAQTTTNKSFNDIQYIGPPLLNDLVGILLRFRQFAFVACADIEKMYRQVLVHPDQRTLQLILWRENKHDTLNMYQLNTVTYGTASAPYLAMRCLRQLALDCPDKQVSQLMLNSFYVDDLIYSHNNKEELLLLCEKINNILKAGCFSLRKWAFNFDSCSPNNLIKSLSLDKSAQHKTLGLGWCNSSDELNYDTKINSNIDVTQITKRKLLSVISQVYDPLGLLSPVIIVTKILMQSLWLCKVDWDDPVPTEIANSFYKILNSLQYLHKVRIPRHVTSQYAHQLQLHIFTDASQEAYGACAYVRSVCKSTNNVTVKLLCAKNKVAPLKPVSIPRLELCGALVGARLYKRISESMDITFDQVLFWTDSTIVLGWLRTHPTRMKTFVQNRVVEVNDLTAGCVWSHVQGVNNPADLLSRGVNLPDLIHNELWWSGPAFIRELSVVKHSTDIPSVLPELRSHTIISTSSCNVFPLERFSSFTKMIRTMAYVKRFLYNLRFTTDRRKGPLSVNELRESTYLLARLSQIESFSHEYNSLSKESATSIKYSRNMSGLNLFLCKNSLIRVGGRLDNCNDFAYDKKHPILLCSKHRFTLLLFQYKHTHLFHAGPQLLLSTIREEWWPLGGRNLARSVVHKCVRCVRMNGKTFNPIMGNLPTERLLSGFPFLRTGTDYCGPVYILSRQGRGSRLIKCYICIFVCFATRSVHLELVTNLSTDGYLLCLKRFISRRGKPLAIYSDNGKNYVGAANELSQFLTKCSNAIIKSVALENITFKFIPPYSPHFGGLWEAGVKSCKYHLRRVVGNSNLTFEEFDTVLVQVEAVLNSRPLTPLSSDPNDLQALTPGHFLIGRPLTAPVSDDLTDAPSNRLPRYDRIEQMRQHFWKRWSKEYVSELQTRTKWKSNKSEVTVNRLVVIKEDNEPPLKWRLGRVTQVYTGKDGVSRVASIRTAAGEVKRAFSKICPLPIDT